LAYGSDDAAAAARAVAMARCGPAWRCADDDWYGCMEAAAGPMTEVKEAAPAPPKMEVLWAAATAKVAAEAAAAEAAQAEAARDAASAAAAAVSAEAAAARAATKAVPTETQRRPRRSCSGRS
jgi:hypothetical protein